MSLVHYLSTRSLLAYLPNQVPLDGDMNKIRAIDQMPDGGVGFQGVFAGRQCHTEHFPTKVDWRGRSSDPATVGDFCIGQNGVLHVSKRASDFIEALEPGVHQFVPFELLKAKKPLDNRFWWVIGNRIDGVDRERSNYVLLGSPIGNFWRSAQDVARIAPDRLPAGAEVKAPPKLVFSAARVGGACIWRDKHIDSGGPFVSQRFADAARAAELTGCEFGEAGELS